MRLIADILIEADRETVFGFFTDSARWAAWWGAGSTIEPRAGGALRIRHSNGFVSEGEVLEMVPPERFVFTFSLQSQQPVPAEDSRVTIRLEQQAAGTLVRVTHEVNDKVVADQLVQGWRFHFSMFANAVAELRERGCAGAGRCVVRAVDRAGRGGAGSHVAADRRAGGEISRPVQPAGWDR